MAGQLRDIKELSAAIEAAGLRGIGKQEILDALQSQIKVGGCFSIRDGVAPIVIAAGWNRIDTWERSIDTQGVRDGLADPTDPGGWYRISNAAAGDYTISATIRFTADVAGDYTIRAAIDDGTTVNNTVYHDAVTVEAGGTGHLAIAAAVLKDVSRNERLQLEIKGPNGASVTIQYGQFGIQR